MFKLHKNDVTALIASAAFALTLASCGAKPTTSEPTNEESVARMKENQEEKEIQTKVEETTEKKEQTKEDSDVKFEDYLDDIKEEVNEMKRLAKEQYETEECQEMVSKVKKRGKELVDFVFNGEEINGVTFDELSEKGKEKAKHGLREIDDTFELLVPNYKERFKDWTIEKGADALDGIDKLKEKYNEYKEEVKERRESRRK